MRRLLSVGLFAWFAAFSLHAQIPGLPGISTAPKKEAAAAPELSEKEKAEQSLKEARSNLAKLEEPGAEVALPEGITAAALASRKRDIEQTILSLNRQIQSLKTAEEARANLETSRAAAKAWTGFPEPPPYSILLLDELENQRQAFDEQRTSYLSSIALFERSLESIREEIAKSSENLRRLNTSSDDGNPATVWKIESERIKLHLLTARRQSLVSQNADLRAKAETAKVEYDLIDRKLAAVRKNVRFTDEDFQKIEAASQSRLSSLRKELSAIRKRQQDAARARTRAHSAHEEALKIEPEDATATTPELSLALTKLEAADAKLDSLQFIGETIEWLIQLESYILTAYQERRALIHPKDRSEKIDAELSLRNLVERLQGWQSVSANELAAVSADLSKQDAKASALAEDDPRLAVISEHRSTLWERQAAIQRVAQAVTLQRQLFERWVTQHSSRDRTWSERFGDAWYNTTTGIKRFFSIEVLRYQKGEGGGEESMRSLTLGRLFAAFFVFLIPYLVARRVIGRLQGISISRGHLGEAQAKTLLNWMMIVVGFMLALTSLKFLDIPLTVFAFLGGALAIGLGFGTQTLIKNFISGIIVLFERKIRVGDILDVDGIIGSVTEINTRSSVLRNADGMETMIPNSMFLENRVTNLTLTSRRSRRTIRVGVAYGTQPSQVIEILKECVSRHGLILKDPEPLVLFEDFGDNALLFGVYFWVEFNDKTNPVLVASDVRIMIDKRFNELGIGVPFPQRDMHLRTDQPIQVEWSSSVKPDETP